MFGWFKRRRRRKILAGDPPGDWLGYLERNVRHWGFLNDQQRERLWQRLRIIVAEKTWAGGRDFQVTEEMKVTIAAQASIMLLGIEAEYYFDGVRTIIVYPGAYVRPQDPMATLDDDDSDDTLLGESWHRGPIVLSWKHVMRAGRGAAHGMNVVFHEFAHFLDGLDGVVEGVPPLDSRDQQKRWYKVTEAEYLKLVGNARRGEATLLDHYGATNMAEFFAVSTECFLERPRAMQQWHRELYDILADFYHQDPAAWLTDAPNTEEPNRRRSSPARTSRHRESSPQPELETADDYFTRGVAHLSDEIYDSAAADFNEAIRLRPDDAEAYLHRAVARLNLNELDGALADCDQALAIEPDDPEVLKTRGSVRLELGQLDTALADLNIVLKESPSDLDAIFLRGRTWLEKNEPRQALADLNRAVMLDPHDAEAYVYRGRAFALLGRHDDAQSDYDRARNLEPELKIEFE